MLKIPMPKRLDTATSPDVEKNILNTIESSKPETLVCDFSKTEYISSAGLRVMLLLTKKTKAAGIKFTLIAMNADVFKIFKLSGFDGIIDIRDTI